MLILNFNPFPILYTNRLLLRRVNEHDANELFNIRSDKEIMKYIDRPLAATIEDALQLIQKINDSMIAEDGITWAITLKDTKPLIGTIGFWRMEKEHYRAEIGYILHPAFQGKGLMQEALSAALNYGFQRMKLHSIMGNVNPENSASIKLLERNNFTREGYFKDSNFNNGKFLDTAIYTIINPEG
ncbi:MAG: GNAT family N-acetyltransferase [Bacteroidia bacterium]|nr:GNAT family N-acetyltransferase [Bacteroidia bacterium]